MVQTRDASGRFTSGGGSGSLGDGYVRILPDMSSFGSSLKKIMGTALAGAGIFGAASFVKSSVGLEASFSKTMNTMAAVANVPAKQMTNLSALAMKMGKDTVFSANDAANAMLELAKGGLSPATIQAGALKSALTLAAAGGVDMATAATVMSNTLNAFNLKGRQAGQVAAALAGGANASTASISSMAQALGQASTVAADAGLSVQETTGAIAAFANAGIQGSDAGTSLKTFLSRLVPTTRAAGEGFDYLNLGFVKADGSMKNLSQISQTLQDKFGGMSQAERSVAFNTLFGSDARRAATVLMNEGSKGIRKYIKATSDQGAAQRTADAAMKGTAGAIEQFKGSLETAQLQFGKLIAPAVQRGLGLLTAGLNGIGPAAKRLGGFLKANVLPTVREFASQIQTKVIPAAVRFGTMVGNNLKPVLDQLVDTVRNQILPAWKSWLPTIEAIAAKVALFAAGAVVLASAIAGKVLPPVIVLVGWLVTFKPLVIGVVAAFVAWKTVTLAMAVAAAVSAANTAFWTAAITANIAVSKAAAVASKVWAAGQWLLNAALTANPLGIIVVAIAAFVAAIVIAYKKSDKFRAIVDKAWSSIKQAVSKAWNGVIKPVLTAWWAYITKVLWPTIKFLWEKVVKPVFSAIGKAIGFVWNNIIKPVFTKWWAYITKVLIPTVKFLWEKVIKPKFEQIGAKIKEVWERWIKPTFAKLKEGVGAIAGAFKTAVSKIKGFWDGLKKAARDPVWYVVNTLYNHGIVPVVNRIPGLGDPLKEVHFAQGGVLPGYTPGRDVHEFVSRTGGKLHLSGGEAIMRPEWVRQMGGPLAVNRMNKAARTGNLRKVGDVGAFADGGSLDPKRVGAAQGFAASQVGKPYVWGGVGPGGYDCSGFMSAITNVLRGQYPYSRVGATASFPWPGFKPGPGEFIIGSSPNYGGSGTGHMAGTLIGTNVESSGGIGVHIGGSARGWNDPGFSEHGHLGHGGGSIWGDIIGKVKGLWDKLHAAVAKLSNMGEWGSLMKQAVTAIAGGIKDWINGKIPGDGPLPSFDSGGVSRRRGSLIKNTMRPERVLSPRQTEAFERLVDLLERNGGAAGPLVNIDTVNTYDVHAAARAISAEQRKALMIASFA